MLFTKKSKKWGYKLSGRAGISGYIYDFEVDGGLGSNGPRLGSAPPNACGENDFDVLRRTDSLGPERHQLFFDNYFSFLKLLIHLKEIKKIWTLSTLNVKRCRCCSVQSDSQLKKFGRGYMEEYHKIHCCYRLLHWKRNF